MSGNEESADDVGADALAFEYVVGTLRGEAREHFATRLKTDASMQASVAFWQEELLALQPVAQRIPSAKVWLDLSQKITPRPQAQRGREAFARWWQWAVPTLAALMLMLALFGYYPRFESATPNADYVAVLTAPSGEAVLTALTTKEGNTMWLKWESTEFGGETHAQLWAISKRDGEARPLAVFSDTATKSLTLNEASWRLVTDAQSLILTREEPGGSAIDEPSDELLAAGVCVRFTSNQGPG